jgi:hypothetical protein
MTFVDRDPGAIKCKEKKKEKSTGTVLVSDFFPSFL